MAKKNRIRDPKIALGYIRVSTSDQLLGPEAQDQAIKTFCHQRGVTLLARFKDLGVSGALPIERRRGLRALLQAAELAGAGKLVVARWDRLSRDAEHSRFLVRLFHSSGIEIVSADGVANGTTPSDRLLRGVLSDVSEYERELICARTKVALAVKKSRGERVGTIPYGWQLASDGQHLEQSKEEQDVIAMILLLNKHQRSARAIASTLNDRKVPARPQHPGGPAGRWHAPFVLELLRREEATREQVDQVCQRFVAHG